MLGPVALELYQQVLQCSVNCIGEERRERERAAVGAIVAYARQQPLPDVSSICLLRKLLTSKHIRLDAYIEALLAIEPGKQQQWDAVVMCELAAMAQCNKLSEEYDDDLLTKILMYTIAYIETPTEQPLEMQAIIDILQGINASLRRYVGHAALRQLAQSLMKACDNSIIALPDDVRQELICFAEASEDDVSAKVIDMQSSSLAGFNQFVISIADRFAHCRITARPAVIADWLAFAVRVLDVQPARLVFEYLYSTLIIQTRAKRYWHDVIVTYLTLKVPLVLQELVARKVISHADIAEAVHEADNFNDLTHRMLEGDNWRHVKLAVVAQRLQQCQLLLEPIIAAERMPTDERLEVHGAQTMISVANIWYASEGQPAMGMLRAALINFDAVFAGVFALSLQRRFALGFVLTLSRTATGKDNLTEETGINRAIVFDIAMLLLLRLHARFDGLTQQMRDGVDCDGDGDDGQSDMRTVSSDAFGMRWCAYTRGFIDEAPYTLDKTEAMAVFDSLLSEKPLYDGTNVDWARQCELTIPISKALVTRVQNKSISAGAAVNVACRTLCKNIQAPFVCLVEALTCMRPTDKANAIAHTEVLHAMRAYVENELASIKNDSPTDDMQRRRIALETALTLLENREAESQWPSDLLSRLYNIDGPPQFVPGCANYYAHQIINISVSAHRLLPGVAQWMRRYTSARDALLRQSAHRLVHSATMIQPVQERAEVCCSETFYSWHVNENKAMFDALLVQAPQAALYHILKTLTTVLDEENNEGISASLMIENQQVIDAVAVAALACANFGFAADAYQAMHTNYDTKEMRLLMAHVQRTIDVLLAERISDNDDTRQWRQQMRGVLKLTIA